LAGDHPGEESPEDAALRTDYRRTGGQRNVRARCAGFLIHARVLPKIEVDELSADAV
jgi:hypothetical protein